MLLTVIFTSSQLTVGVNHIYKILSQQHLNQYLIKQCEIESRSVLSDSLQAYGLYSPWNSLGQHTGVGSHFLLQGVFPTQGSNLDLQHCRQILYQLSHKGSPRILE